jgi:hypothetical protein
LAKQVDQRYASAKTLIGELKKLQHSESRAFVQNKIRSSNTYSNLMPLAVGSLMVLVMALWYLHKKLEPDAPGIACHALSSAQLNERDQLLEIADLHEAVGRVNYPTGANALDAYRKALQVDPCSQIAMDALERLSTMENLSIHEQ